MFTRQDLCRRRRKQLIMRPPVLALILVVVAVALAACGGSRSSSTSAAGPTPASPTTTVTVTRPTTRPAPPPKPSGIQLCRASTLALSFLGQQGAAGHGELGFALRNTGSVTCHTSGFPGVLWLDRSGRGLPTSPKH